jgi:non-lysosomal glucosylceramidase
MTMQRRDFLKISTLTSACYGVGCSCTNGEVAQAISPEELYAKYIPADKQLSADWLASLTKRAHPLDSAIAYSKQDVDLEIIGMTVGGIACGTVYISGDGRLWVWDIFNQHHEGVVANQNAKAPAGLRTIQNRQPRERDGANFLAPPRASDHKNGVRQHFELDDGSKTRRLDGSSWQNVQFTGRWPIGQVAFSNPASPIQVTLEAYSPFIPLNLADSSLPLTVMEYTLTNTGSNDREVKLVGHLHNPLGQFSQREACRRTVPVESNQLQGIHHFLSEPDTPGQTRCDRVLFDFESGTYEGWDVEGSSFGKKPATKATTPAYQGDTNSVGAGFINSHASADVGDRRPGDIIRIRDAAQGVMTSPEFTIDRKFLAFRIGGGKRAEIGIDLIIDGKAVRSTTGHNSNVMRAAFFDVADLAGKNVQIVIRDEYSGGWGNIGADHFVLTDNSHKTSLTEQLDYGSMTMAYVGSENATVSTDTNQVSVATSLVPGQSKTLRFAISWHLPNLNSAIGLVGKKRHYATKFADSLAVINYFAQQQDRLTNLTRTWVRTWNDSTLPQWFLDRTILTTNTLQTQNAIIFEDGRFWAWEGIGCCPGTCGHVWEYSQGHARLFPEIERNLREVTDFGIAQQRDGSITFRGSNNGISAIDAQCGYILRTLRDHQLSDDPGFLHRVWPATRKAIDYLIAFDKQDSRGGLDGLLDGEQHNTLDAEWFGKVHVLCSMYLAALRAGEELSQQAGDNDFAKRCRKVFELGSSNIAKLFNGEYYEQIDDPAHAAAIGVGKGCYIDQAMGQFWANQLGLGRLCNAQHQKSALRALWKYNFVPEYGAFRTAFPEGRHYATASDSGLLMCTWPMGGLRDDFKRHWQYAYFNEVMTGFEYEVAAHMVSEGDDDLVEKGLAVTRAVHDRYSATRGRNPYNEIECSDHYARAGASYGVFLAVAGFEFDQASGRLAFAPVIQKDHFRTPFTTSRAWGTYEQKEGQVTIKITHGELLLNTLDLDTFQDVNPKATMNGAPVRIENVQLKQGDVLRLSMT